MAPCSVNATGGLKKDPAKERAIADKVRRFFDFDGLARMALGRHWNTATAAQRKEYKEVFATLVEDSYLKRSRDLVGKYDIVFGREEVKANRAKVISRVIRSDADVEIVYELHRKPKNWMIYNIVLDGVDLIRNYQTQFNSIILKSGWDSLISRLRKKKDEINADVTL
jgi:phospholipid transport system substrate-binding protein